MSLSPKEQGHKRDRMLFLGSGVILLATIIISFAKAQRWGTSYIDLYITANDVNSLTSGEDVRIAGIPIGKVGTLHLTNQGKVKVQLKIESKHAHLIGANSEVRLAQEGLIGDPYLTISADPRPQKDGIAINGSTISYVEPISVDSLLTQLSASQQELHTTLRNTSALTAKDGSITTAFEASKQLAASLSKEVNRTAPVVRESISSISNDIDAVSKSTERVENSVESLITTTQPLMVDTIKDTDQLIRSSQQVINLLHDFIGPWLEPADGRQTNLRASPATDGVHPTDEPSKQTE